MTRLVSRWIFAACLFGTFGAGGLAEPWTPAAAAEPSDAVGANMALGAKYTLWPAPNYVHCTDPDDNIQLTDGQTTTAYFWTQTSTVGWSSAAYVVITIDLGKLQPISGVSFHTAAGVAGVTWPAAIQILTSDDGKTYHNAGDLVELDRRAHGPMPEGYAIRRLMTDQLRTRGRYVRLVAVPPAGGPYLFVDEIEVFRGSHELLDQPPAGELVEDVAAVFVAWRSHAALSHRFHADAAALEARMRRAPLPDEALRAPLLDRFREVRDALDAQSIPVDGSFRAILPLGPTHEQLFRLQADLWQAMGQAPLVAAVAQPWDPLDPFEPPAARSASALEVHTMRGEHRAAAVNLYNATGKPSRCKCPSTDSRASPCPTT
jgi:hypothetical protein